MHSLACFHFRIHQHRLADKMTSKSIQLQETNVDLSNRDIFTGSPAKQCLGGMEGFQVVSQDESLPEHF